MIQQWTTSADFEPDILFELLAQEHDKLYHKFNSLGSEYIKEFIVQEAANLFDLRYALQVDPEADIVAHGAGITYDGSGNVTAGTITSFDVTDPSGNVAASFSGFSLSAVQFYTAITNDSFSDPNGRYQYLVSLLHDATQTANNTYGYGFEAGTGNSTITATGGYDGVYVWQSCNLTYHGTGTDLLSFQSYAGGPYPNEPSTGVVVNLRTGTATNPYGGTITFTGVAGVVGTDKGDVFIGNDSGNYFGDGIYNIGADTTTCGAGNDTINLAEGFLGNNGGVHADGGGGVNTIAVNFHFSNVPGPHKLDLADQSKNSGIFQGDVLTNFQIFVHGTGFFAADGQTFIFIDNNQSRHTVEAMGQTNTITFHGGSDTLILYDTVASGYTVQATGAGGTNTLDLGDRLLDSKNTFDFANQAKNSGIFAHVRFTKVGSITGAHLVSAPTDGELVVIGGKGPESITGTYKSDLLRAGSGNDTMNGGGGGDDTTYGGPGHDVFVFNSALTPRQHTDSIINFAVSRDRIELDKTIFVGIGHNGVLAKSHFDTGAHAHHASDRIIYNPGSGGLFYHAPGTPLGHQVEFAILAKHLALSHADFLVV
jgi:hypothetical protein